MSIETTPSQYPLSGKYLLIAEGQYLAAGYPDAFSALMSLALYCVRRGMPSEEFAGTAWKAGTAVRRTRKSRLAGEKVATKAFAQAWAYYRPGARSKPTASGLQRWVEQSALWLYRVQTAEWRGRGAAAERKVLAALTERALQAQDLCVNASQRLLAEETLLPRKTVAAALLRLQRDGWLRLQHVEGGATMAWLETKGVSIFDALEEVYSSASGIDVTEPVMKANPDEVFDEAFARRGLGRHHGFVLVAVGEDGATTREVADATHLTMATTRRHLKDLAAMGLLARDGRRWMRTDVALETVATSGDLPGVRTDGLRDRMRATHEAERWHFAIAMEEAEEAKRAKAVPREVLVVEVAPAEPVLVQAAALTVGLRAEDFDATVAAAFPAQDWSQTLVHDEPWRRELMMDWIRHWRTDEVMMAEGRRMGVLPPLKEDLDHQARALVAA